MPRIAWIDNNYFSLEKTNYFLGNMWIINKQIKNIKDVIFDRLFNIFKNKIVLYFIFDIFNPR